MEKKASLLTDGVIWEISYEIVDEIMKDLSKEELYKLAEKGWGDFKKKMPVLDNAAQISSFPGIAEEVVRWFLEIPVEKVLKKYFGEGGKTSEALKKEQEETGKIQLT